MGRKLELKQKLILEFKRAPGDVLMMTGLVRDLKRTYGERFQLDVRTQFPAIWRHNPHLTKLDRHARDVQTINLGGNKDDAADKEGIRLSKAGAKGSAKVHYATVFHRVFEKRTGWHVPILEPKGDLHLSEDEKARPLIGGRYWIIVPGGKTDMTNKWWHYHRYQEVVDKLRPWGLQFVQEGATKDLHVHPPLTGVLNAVGQTSVRDIILNIHHAEGVISGCSFPMHVAGALSKPCVVLFGGREEPWYEAYCDDYNAFGDQASPTKVPHRLLHTMGLLPCCKTAGCWLRRVEKLHDGQDEYDKSLCVKPHVTPGRPTVPECLDMITTDHVLEAVMSYYEDGTLKPISTPTGKYSEPPKRPTPIHDKLVKDLTDAGVVIGNRDLVVPPAGPPSMPPLPTFLRPTEQQETGQAKTPTPKTTEIPSPAVPAAKSKSADVLDHPLIGGRVTIFALLYGDEVNLHRRCLTSICETVPPSRMDLRVFGNQIGTATINFLSTLPISYMDLDSQRRRKVEAMRLAFQDAQHPIETSWLIWFDDVSFVRHGKWLHTLAETIINQKAEDKVAILGPKLRHTVAAVGKDPRRWFQNASWWRGRDLRNKLGADAPNGDQIHYVNSNFFALRTDTIQVCGIPDSRLTQSGSGIVIGEQLHQGGFKAKAFSDDGKFVQAEQSNAKRGYKEKYPWQ